MPAPFTVDLRLRVLFQYEILGRSVERVASDNMMSERTVWRYLRMSRDPLASLIPKKIPGRPLVLQSSGNVLFQVMENPLTSLEDVRWQILMDTGSLVSSSTASRSLRRLGVTHQNLTKIASQRDDFLRATYFVSVEGLSPHQMVFFDEMGAQLGAINPNRGVSLRGIRPKMRFRFGRSLNHNLLAAISWSGPLAAEVLKHTIDSDDVLLFLMVYVFPHMSPFPGPNSVLVLGEAFSFFFLFLFLSFSLTIFLCQITPRSITRTM